MLRRLHQWWIPALLGLLSGLVVLFLLWAFGNTVLRVQVAVSDFVFLDDRGPRLGRLQVSDEIVLVLFDTVSYQEMGALPTYEDDLELYRLLLDAGAKAIADTRIVADGGGDETVEIRQFLEKIIETKAEGRLFRDIWIASKLPEDFLASVEPYVANNLLNLRSNADSFFETRLYPLVRFSAGQNFRESMPLVLARVARGLGTLSSDEVLEQIKACGIFSVWEESFQEGPALEEDVNTEEVGAKEYPFLNGKMPWFQFLSNSPLVLPVGYWVSYAWSPADFTRVSYSEVDKAAVEQFADKIVLIGFETSIDPNSDTYTVPCQPQRAAAPEVLACALQTLLQPRLMIGTPFPINHATIIGLSIFTGLIGGLLKPIRAIGIVFVTGGLWFALAVVAFRMGWYVDLALTPLALMLSGVSGAGYRYVREIRWRLQIVDLFGRYVPRAVVTQLVQQPDAEALSMGGIKREVSVLFADIRGFTPFAEKIPPEEVIEQLNSLLKILVDCTFANEGTVDKFIGDAILVLFNAPLDQSDHAERAAKTACAMQRGIAQHASGLTVGIGIHRGEAVVGRVGTSERMEYTAVGSTVNLASRLCSAAESGTVVVSDALAESLEGSDFQLVAQPPLQVKGFDTELHTFLLSG